MSSLINTETSSRMAIDREWLSWYFRSFYKDEKDLLVGLESELLGVHDKTGEAIPYQGEYGVEGVLKGLIQSFRWEPVEEAGKIIALKRDRAEIHLEPGGQLELSGTPFHGLRENLKEIQNHYEELRSVSQGRGIAWLELGMQPFSTLERISWVPKARYHLMRDLLSRKGKLAHRMMKQTATLQANLDYTGEADAMKKLRTAMALAPVMVALFANSPLSEGKFSGAMSLRAQAWQKTDPDRCGIIKEMMIDEPAFENYFQYLLKVPLLFLIREGEWLNLPPLSFGEFLEKGYLDFSPAEEDWELFLTSVFTESRLNPFVEVRSADRNRLTLSFAMLALWKGLLFDAQACEAAWRLVRNYTFEERVRALEEAARDGLQSRWGNHAMRDLALELTRYAESALKRLWVQKILSEDESVYLQPLYELLKEGKSPAEKILALWGGPWNYRPQELVAYCRI